jgi:hypothetical protein
MNWSIGFYGKYVVASLRRKKDVYRQIGLPHVRETIDLLLSMAGQPPSGMLAFEHWSLRDLFRMLGCGPSGKNPLLQKPSARALSTYLMNAVPTVPTAPPGSRISLRSLLQI